MNELEKMLRGEVPASPDDARAAAERFVARAADEGLADVAYALVDSPLGTLLAAQTKHGLVELAYGGEDPDPLLLDLSGKLSPRVLEAPAKLDDVRRQLDEYFEGRRTSFDVPIDWTLSRGFTQRILQATAKVPFGQLATYRDVATKAGNERAVRAAGNALGSNHIPIVVPCHRIIRTGGALGGYTGGLERKEFLLKLEGVIL
jgi:methylated-DNA-[protein]-cysteine S-methyltransferase